MVVMISLSYPPPRKVSRNGAPVSVLFMLDHSGHYNIKISRNSQTYLYQIPLFSHMKNHKYAYWVLAIFLVTLATRLIIAFTIPNFTYDSYFHLRQVEEISSTGLPLYQDPLSYGGRTLRFLPFFHYFMALFDLVLPIELIVKILPNLLLATLTITVFFIGKKISGNDEASLFSAAIVGFLPILFFTNTFSPLTLFLPLLFLNIYAFMNIKEPNYIYLYIASFLLLSFTSSATFLLIVGFGIYLLLSFIEGKRTARSELELIIFSLFFFIWIQFIFFKNVLVKQGIAFIWQNIPAQIIQEY